MTQRKLPPCPSKGQRNSNIELYRIIATFTVLIVHFNGWFVGGMPEKFDISNPSAFRIGQMIIEAATCICVNMFILISGYFRIKLRLISLVSLLIKLLFIFIPFYVVFAFLQRDFQWGGLFYQFRVITRAGWFIQCYVMLMFFSPVLNAFVEKYGNRILIWTIILVFIEFWFGCIMSVQIGKEDIFAINEGYSVIHFVLMYMIGRCISLNQDAMKKLKARFWILAWIVCTLLICIMHVMGLKFVWDYSNPLVIISSVCSFVPFLFYSFYNGIVNWVGKSTLYVYIIHSDTPLVHELMRLDNQILADHSYISYLTFISGIIILVFCGCIIYDKLVSLFITPLIKQISLYLYGKFEYE